MRLSILSFALSQLVSQLARAQQYVGQTIPNSLPGVTDGAVSFFQIIDPNGGPSSTLINYFSAPGGQQIDTTQVQRAIVVLHGANRDPYNYFNDVHAALYNASSLYNSEITTSSVAIMAPYFPNEDDENVGYPFSGKVTFLCI
jgi:hypothetical protein